MKIKATQQKAPEPPFIPVMMEILIETKEEAEMVQALFNSVEIEDATKKAFGAYTPCIDIPGVSERVTIRLRESLRELYAEK